MPNDPDYGREWADLRRRTRIFWIIFLGYIPGVVILNLLAGLIAPSLTPMWIAVPWMGAFMAAGIYRALFRCPRCHKRFFYKGWYSSQFIRNCLHCDLPLGSSPPQQNSN
jgi:hypothetical protein